MRGVNLSGSCKLPFRPYLPSYEDGDGAFFNDLDVSFVGRPFPLDEADLHLSQIRSWGFNVIRLVLTWEAVEHFGPGIYDDDYVDYLIEIIRRASRHGLSCFLDPHQDVWSRHCGGSGAPNWTLRLAGLNAEAFLESGAAICHSQWLKADKRRRVEEYPAMIWQTNCNDDTCVCDAKLASATMFTLFFGGRRFAPRFLVDDADGDGARYNVQDYLQAHFVSAMTYVARRVHDADVAVLGWDSLNEPDPGWIGCPDITGHLPWQTFRSGPTPTPFQALRLGAGYAETISDYRVAWYGPTWDGLVEVNGQGAHVDAAIATPDLPDGCCIWAGHGVWDATSGALLDPAYFAPRHDADTFIDAFWLPFVRRFARALRRVVPRMRIFLDPPVNERPPFLDSGAQDDDDLRRDLVYAPHWYDGLTLINKDLYPFNVDYLHVLRGLKTLVGALRLGYPAIRRGMQSQLALIAEEGADLVGDFPVLLGEIGVPFDMPGEASRRRALDANLRAIERNLLNATLWTYVSDNDDVYGDRWNGENLSVVDGRGRPRCASVLVRPFPRATCGLARAFAFDADASRLDFQFESSLRVCPSCLESQPWPRQPIGLAPARLVTEVFLPATHFHESRSISVATTPGDTWVLDFDRQVLEVAASDVTPSVARPTRTLVSWDVPHPPPIVDASSSMPSACLRQALERLCNCFRYRRLAAHAS
ncbi:hypothetical protein PBRA_008566 [Plasmodiophora brassicae]|uniref:Glycoside hydrolase family 5 domain-containing protein n=1 Tax=Plasmodiophora brassicae TaxID=37360 RepID=A0A0G4J2S3_PLABS|nr:hypothetical protein PBRA_008566 [Plasmodiophora brassicae]